MRSRRFWVSAAFIGALAVALAVVSGLVASSHGSAKPAYLIAKADSESAKNLAGIANEGPDATLAAQEEAARAYPADSVPVTATENSISTFKSLRQHGHGQGNWHSIGPSQARYPAVLDQFLAVAGRTSPQGASNTALAIGGCKKHHKCRLYLGAAGGGVWTADRATDGDGNVHWQFKSGSFATNAIGSLLVDPSDQSGNTVYAGTGEPNASGDSEAGRGIYKSTNGGDSWTLVPGSDLFRDRAVATMAFDGAGNLLVGIASAVRGISSVTGGAVGCPTPNGCAVRGVYRQTGSTFTLLRATNIRGTNEVAVDPNNPNVLYQASFAEGVWRSLDNGATWTQIKTPLNAALSTDRAQFALAKLPGGKTRMYVGVGNQSDAGANRARFYRTDDAAGAAVFADMTTPQNIGYCTAQCWYDNFVVSPVENANVVYLGGSFDYGTVNGPSNGRALLLSTDGGTTWSDDQGQGNDGWIHPDQHALVTVPGQPLQFIDGNDGGVVRANGKYVDGSSQCDSRGLDPASNAYCKSLLSRIPQETTVLNRGLVTLQFQSLSVDPKDPKGSLMGGTQDNGTFEFKGESDVWPQIIYGDGGQSGWNAANSRLRFNTFTGQANDVNFRNGDPSYWVIATGAIVSSPEGSQFYPPIIADPSAANAGSIFQGSQSVWRTQDWGGDQAYLEANCPEFTTSAADPNCGDFVRIGAHPARPTSTLRPRTAPTGPAGTVGAIERATKQQRHHVGRHDHGSRVHHRQRERSRRVGPVDAARPVGGERSEPVRQLDLHRSGEREPRVDLLLGLQHQHADPPGARVRGHPGGRCGDVGRSHVRPR